jgi:hypothetical protein
VEVLVALVDRAQRILTTPAAEWPVIAQEPATPASLYSGYIVPLAAIPPIGSFLSTVLFLHRGIFAAAVISLVSFVAALVSVYLVALIAENVAPSFGAGKDRIAALKWVAYSYTASWVAGIALLIPVIGAFVALLGSLYSLYLLFLGAVPVMRVPQEKAIGYVAVVIVAAIVLGVFVGLIVGILFGILAAGTMLTTGGIH